MKHTILRIRNLLPYLWKRLPGRILLLILLLVLPLNVLSIAAMRSVNGMVLERSSLSAQAQLQDVLEHLTRRMDNAVRLQFYFESSDESCIRMLSQTEDNYTYRVSRMKFYAKLKTMAQITDGADAYFYHIQGVDFFQYSVFSDASTIGKAILEQELSKGWSGWKLIRSAEKNLLVFMQAGQPASSVYGCWIELDSVTDGLLSDLNYKTVAIRFRDRAGNEVFIGGPEDLWDSEAAGRGKVFLHTGDTKLSLDLAIPRREMLGRLSIYRWLTESLAVISLCILPRLYMALRKLTVVPISELNRASKEIRKGNEAFRITAKGITDEFREAFLSFNTMADSLRDYRISAYEKELEAQDMELMNLQLQIRPHFLLNTFNLMYNLVKLNAGETVQEIILYLSDYFRYMFREGRQMELLPRELELIRSYIHMADVRYSGRVHAEYELDPELDFLRVPPLLLHNFVENAVKYGVRESGDLNILIRGEYRDGKVMIQISNDGSGMPPDIFERNRRILSGELIPENRNAHVGLFNSYRRLRYFYGEEASVTLDCEPGVLTVFTICFPYQLDTEALGNEKALYSEQGQSNTPDETE